jgi:hypothetical protein
MWLETLIEMLSRIKLSGPPQGSVLTSRPLLQPPFPLISLGFYASTTAIAQFPALAGEEFRVIPC